MRAISRKGGIAHSCEGKRGIMTQKELSGVGGRKEEERREYG